MDSKFITIFGNRDGARSDVAGRAGLVSGAGARCR
jgi:hypothetical protein